MQVLELKHRILDLNRRILEAEACIVFQRSLVTRLERAGDVTGKARELLVRFELLRTQQVIMRDQFRQRLRRLLS